MSYKILVVLILLTLNSVPSAATIKSASISISAFNIPPAIVYNVSNTTDSTAWANGYYANVFYGAGSTNDTAYAWLVNYDGSSTINKLVKRTINTTILANTLSTNTTEPFVTKQDVIIVGSISAGNAIISFGGLGYLAFVGNPTDVNGDLQIVVNVITGNSTGVATMTITKNNDPNTVYNIETESCGWWEDGYFYFVYVTTTSSQDVGISLQAVSADGTKTLYSSPIQVATFSQSLGYASISGGPSNYTNSTYIIIAYKDTTLNQVIQFQIARSSGTVVTKTTLITDTTTIAYTPVGVINSNSTTGTIIAAYDSSSGIYTLYASYNGTTTLTQLPLAIPNYYEPYQVTGMNYLDGYAIIAALEIEGPTIYTITSFYANGTTRSSEEIIGITMGPANYFVDANGSIWFGYTKYNDGGYTLQGYLGQLLEQTSTYGYTLAPLYAFILFAIASLLAF